MSMTYQALNLNESAAQIKELGSPKDDGAIHAF